MFNERELNRPGFRGVNVKTGVRATACMIRRQAVVEL